MPQLDFSRKLHRDLWAGALSRAEGAWKSHVAAWKTWHGLNVGDAPAYERLGAFIEARNAVMHGVGQLTRLQTQRDGGARVIQKLGSVGIVLNGTRLVIVPSVLQTCAATAKEYVLWLDAAIQEQELLAA